MHILDVGGASEVTDDDDDPRDKTDTSDIDIIVFARLSERQAGDASAGYSATLAIQHLVYTDTGQLKQPCGKYLQGSFVFSSRSLSV